jgi:2-oxoisovalerate dehydrogenase E1 component
MNQQTNNVKGTNKQGSSRLSHTAACSAEELLHAYRVGVRSRCVEEHIVRLVSRGEVKFSIWGPGEEVHGTATALALSKAVDSQHFGIVPHYRSGALVSMWCSLNGIDDFSLRLLRQQFSKATDLMSGGRQMVYHVHLPEIGILPVQSAVGMQLGKAAGYALGFKSKGITDGLAMAIIGDGTTAEGDLHDAMNACSVWSLPLLIVVTDNNIAISTTPEEGRGIVDFDAYAQAFGLASFACDGRDFWDVFETTHEAARHVRQSQSGAILHVRDLPRFNGHSSAADVTFDLGQDDPLVGFGAALVERELLKKTDVLTRQEGQGRDFFAHHSLGAIMSQENETIATVVNQVREEPDPDPATLYDHIYAPFPAKTETAPTHDSTIVSYAGAIRSALDKLITRHNGVCIGQDIGRLGGVMTATAGLKKRHPEHVIDAPLNEPLIVGTATGLGLHKDLMALPEVQFGDYSLNTLHWLVHIGNLHWSTLGQASTKLVLRMPTDPFGGGAMYHSMSLEGFYGSIPGLVIIMPCTSYDIHGLLLTAGEYDGPVLCLEPKWMYRQSLGPAFPGEPTDKQAIVEFKKQTMRGEIPDLPDVSVPFGKGIVRREGSDLTIVAWGRAVWTALDSAAKLEQEGLSAEVIDLRTLVPPDMAIIEQSLQKTGRLIVAAEDRNFAGFVRQIQGACVERFPGLPSLALGQKNIPGIAQSLVLEDGTILNAEDIVSAGKKLMTTTLTTHTALAPETIAAPDTEAQCNWIPPRYFIS